MQFPWEVVLRPHCILICNFTFFEVLLLDELSIQSDPKVGRVIIVFFKETTLCVRDSFLQISGVRRWPEQGGLHGSQQVSLQLVVLLVVCPAVNG